MEAKDTVKVGRHNESVYCSNCGEEFGIESKVEYEREFQAEVSFKAGQLEERKRILGILKKEYPAITTWKCWEEIEPETDKEKLIKARVIKNG